MSGLSNLIYIRHGVEMVQSERARGLCASRVPASFHAIALFMHLLLKGGSILS